MRDRLQSVRFSRSVRNVSLCLSLAFLVESGFLLYNTFVLKHYFLPSSLIFLILAVLSGAMARHYHTRFRSRK